MEQGHRVVISSVSGGTTGRSTLNGAMSHFLAAKGGTIPADGTIVGANDLYVEDAGAYNMFSEGQQFQSHPCGIVRGQPPCIPLPVRIFTF